MKALLALMLLTSTACLRVETVVRQELGPTLRTFERPSVVANELEAALSPSGPTLRLTVTTVDTCRIEVIDEHAETLVTEHSTPAAGAALGTGIAAGLAGGALLLASFVVSGAPDVTRIDAAGHFGASPRQHLQAVALGAGIVSVPALIGGLIATVRGEQERKVRRVEKITSQKDRRCNERPALGSVSVVDPEGARVSVGMLSAGAVGLSLEAVKNGLASLELDFHPLRFSAKDSALLSAFVDCAQGKTEACTPSGSAGE